MRRAYLDNLRWATVLLVLVYHVFYMFNAAGVLGGVGSFYPRQPQDLFLYFVYPWFMLLLFVISGICSRYALEKTGAKSFIKSRTRKLLVPSTLGLFVFQWIVGYFNIKAGDGLNDIPALLRYPIFAVSGTGPLWFIQVLWLYSLLICLIRRLDRSDKIYALGGKCGSALIISFAAVIWGAAQILNLPVLTTYRCGIYFAGFAFGYFVLSHDEAQESVEKLRLPLLAAALILGAFYIAVFRGESYAGAHCLQSPLTSAFAWLMTLALLGCGKAWFNGVCAFSKYMTGASFGIYIVHYLLVIAPCYLLKTYTAWPPLLIYALCCAITLIGSPLLYELLKRVPFVRYAVFGIKSPALPQKTQ